MKKKIIIVILILILFISFFPIPNKMKDGGTVHYKALMYDIYDVHRLTFPIDDNDDSVKYEYIEGTIIKILGYEVYNNTNPHIDM